MVTRSSACKESQRGSLLSPGDAPFRATAKHLPGRRGVSQGPVALQHIAEMDRLYEAACEVENTIEESVAAEEFADAVRLRGVHAELQDRDEVNTVLKVRPRSRSFWHRSSDLAQTWNAGTLL